MIQKTITLSGAPSDIEQVLRNLYAVAKVWEVTVEEVEKEE